MHLILGYTEVDICIITLFNRSIVPFLFLKSLFAKTAQVPSNQNVTTRFNCYSLQMQLPAQQPSLVRELEPSSWMMCSVVEMKTDLWTAPTAVLAFTTVHTLKMQESPV